MRPWRVKLSPVQGGLLAAGADGHAPAAGDPPPPALVVSYLRPPPVADRLHPGAALMNGRRPGDGEGGVQAIQPGRPEMAGIDVEEDDRPAVAVRRPGVELARAAIGAIAVDELHAMEFPIDH